MSRVTSPSTRKRGRGNTPTERKLSRAAFKAWDTRNAKASLEKKRRSRAAKKAAKTRRAT